MTALPLQLRNLRKSYGALNVTDDVSLDIAGRSCTPSSAPTEPARPR